MILQLGIPACKIVQLINLDFDRYLQCIGDESFCSTTYHLIVCLDLKGQNKANVASCRLLFTCPEPFSTFRELQ